MKRHPPIGPEVLNPLIQALSEAGEDDLANRLAAHGAGKAQGQSLDELAKLWLD